MDARDPPPAAPPPGDGDGVRITARPRTKARGPVIALVAIAVVAGLLGWRLLATRTAHARTDDVASHAGDAADASTTGASAAVAGRASARPASRRHAASSGDGEDPTPDLSDYVLPGEAPTMPEVIDALHRRGIHGGLGAFPPPGTSPPLVGLEVPEGFPLPEGYVRHHQATDDGQRIAPILMFHPDLRHIEIGGRRIAVPADRVVTPDLAPAGMPLRRVRIPPPRDGGGGS